MSDAHPSFTSSVTEPSMARFTMRAAPTSSSSRSVRTTGSTMTETLRLRVRRGRGSCRSRAHSLATQLVQRDRRGGGDVERPDLAEQWQEGDLVAGRRAWPGCSLGPRGRRRGRSSPPAPSSCSGRGAVGQLEAHDAVARLPGGVDGRDRGVGAVEGEVALRCRARSCPPWCRRGRGVCPASHTSSTRRAAAVRMMAPTLNGPCTSSSTSADATRPCDAATLGAAASCRCRRAASRRAHLEHAVARLASCGGRRTSPPPPTSGGASRPRGASARRARRARRVPAGPARCRAGRAGRALPMRIGGFDHSSSTTRSAGTSSGGTARTLASPSRSAFARHRSSARSFTSTAHTVAAGERRRERARDRSVAAAEVDQGALRTPAPDRRAGGASCPCRSGRARRPRGRWRG